MPKTVPCPSDSTATLDLRAQLRALADHAAQIAVRDMGPAERARFAMSLRSHNPFKWYQPTQRHTTTPTKSPRRLRVRSRTSRTPRSTRAGPSCEDSSDPADPASSPASTRNVVQA